MDLNKECWVCGKPEEYNTCILCATDVFINKPEGMKAPESILHHIEVTNPKRFKQILKINIKQ